MAKKFTQMLLVFVFLHSFITSCTKMSEEEMLLDKLLNTWPDVYVFYTNDIDTIGKLGFLNPETVSLIHQQLITNSEFNQKVLKRFSSVDEYIKVFSNVIIHYAFLSFSNTIGTNISPEKIDEIVKLIAKGSLKENPNREKIILLYTRLKEYLTLSTNISENWLDTVSKHEEEIIKMLLPLVAKQTK